jgi:hypothetical protein
LRMRAASSANMRISSGLDVMSGFNLFTATMTRASGLGVYLKQQEAALQKMGGHACIDVGKPLCKYVVYLYLLRQQRWVVCMAFRQSGHSKNRSVLRAHMHVHHQRCWHLTL